MVRIWVASLHQKSSSVFITLELFVLLVRETHKCGWIRTAAATSLKTAQKQPSGLFLAARLAISTRAHQKDQRRKYAGFCFIRYLKFHSRGWIRTAAARRIVRRAKKPLRGFFRCAARDIHPRPPKNLNVRKYAEVFVLLQSQTHRAGGFEQQRSRPPPAAETGRRGWGSAPLFQSPAKGLRKKRHAQLVRPAE